MTHRPLLIGVACGLAAALVAAAVALWMGFGPFGGQPPTGPMEVPPENGFIPNNVQAGDKFTYGQITLNLRGSSPAVIMDVEPVDIHGDSLKYLGSLVGLPARENSGVGAYPGFPPHGYGIVGHTAPIEGTPIWPANKTPKQFGYELLMGYQMVKDEFGAVGGVQIKYSVEGKDYEVVMPSRLVVCPARMSPSECSKAADATFPPS